MAVVKLELDRERALRETVRIENFLKRTPPDIKEALRELEAADGLEALLKAAPLVEGEPPPPPPPPPDGSYGLPFLYEDHWPSLRNGDPFILGGDNQSGAAKAGARTVTIKLSGERYEFSSPVFDENTEYAFQGGVIVGSDLQWGGAGHHCTMFQLSKGVGAGAGGSPPQSLELGDYGAGKGLYLHDQQRSTQYTKIATINTGQRYVLGVHEKMNHTSGFYEITLDAKVIASATNTPTMQGGNEAIIKFGLYGGAGTITWDNCKFWVRT